MTGPAMRIDPLSDPDHLVEPFDIIAGDHFFNHCRAWGLQTVMLAQDPDGQRISLVMVGPVGTINLHAFITPATARLLAANLIETARQVEDAAGAQADRALERAQGKRGAQ